MIGMGEIRIATDELEDLKCWKTVGDLKLYWRTGKTYLKERADNSVDWS